MTAAALDGLREQVDWCLRQNRVRALYTYLGRDGRRMICLFHAPDTEAVRRVNRQAKLPAHRVWTGSVHAPPAAEAPAPATLAVVERSFAEPVRFEEIQALEDGGGWCLQQHRVRFLRTYFSSDRRRMICVYTAPDAEAVRRAQKTIGMPFDEVWAAELAEH